MVIPTPGGQVVGGFYSCFGGHLLKIPGENEFPPGSESPLRLSGAQTLPLAPRGERPCSNFGVLGDFNTTVDGSAWHFPAGGHPPESRKHSKSLSCVHIAVYMRSCSMQTAHSSPSEAEKNTKDLHHRNNARFNGENMFLFGFPIPIPMGIIILHYHSSLHHCIIGSDSVPNVSFEATVSSNLTKLFKMDN